MTTTEQPLAVAEERPRRSLAVGTGLLVERYGVIVAWLAVIVFFCALRPNTFASTSTIRLVLSTQTVILLASLALMLTLAVGELDLSIGSVVGFGGTLMAVLNGVHDLPVAVSLLLTVAICLLFGAVNAALVVWVGVPSIIVTLGSGTLLAGVTLAIADSKVSPGSPRR